MDKKGLSAVIISLILILLAIVVSGVLWVVISNVVQTGSEEITLGSFFLDLQIENVKVESNGDVSITVKRGAGDADLTGIAFIISNGKESVVVEEPTALQELGTNTFTIEQAELGNIGFAKEVSIAPIITEDEKEKTGRIVNTEELSDKVILENLGAIAWWKFEGDAIDEIGGNHGTMEQGASFANGKHGQAGNFDGIDDYVDLPSVNPTEAISVAAWIKSDLSSGYKGFWQLVSKYNAYILGTGSPDSKGIAFIIWNKTTWGYGNGYTVPDPDKWHFFVGTYDSSQSLEKLYSDGSLVDTQSFSGLINADTGPINMARREAPPGDYFDGKIDEVIIFDRALTDNEVKALYELDLS